MTVVPNSLFISFMAVLTFYFKKKEEQKEKKHKKKINKLF